MIRPREMHECRLCGRCKFKDEELPCCLYPPAPDPKMTVLEYYRWLRDETTPIEGEYVPNGEMKND